MDKQAYCLLISVHQQASVDQQAYNILLIIDSNIFYKQQAVENTKQKEIPDS
jgi:hypothetical protein